jgi:hypothetical protein
MQSVKSKADEQSRKTKVRDPLQRILIVLVPWGAIEDWIRTVELIVCDVS